MVEFEQNTSKTSMTFSRNTKQNKYDFKISG